MDLVVKLGGSVMAHSMSEWTRVLARAGGRSRLVVPGGGKFAETVREAQIDAARELRFSHRTAHDMAILAMHQFGLLVSEHLPEYQRLLTVDDVVAAAAQTQTGNAIWLPDPHDLKREQDVVVGWDMTSDAFSVWLAAKANIKQVVLLKSVPAEELSGRPLPQLVASGHVDALCGQFGSRFDVQLQFLGAGEHSRLHEILES